MKYLFILFPILAIAPLFGDDSRLNDAIKKLEKYADEERKRWNVVGLSIAVTKDDQVAFAKGFGERGLNDKQPVDENTLFQIGSLGKAFTSALVGIGVDKGLVKWDDKVIDHLPEFRVKDPWVTAQFEIMDLMSQRSGLPAHFGDSQSLLGYSGKEIIESLPFCQPVSSFRSKFDYQNVFFLVAANILTEKTGLSYPEMLQKELFDKLGMKGSSITLKDYLASKNRAEWMMRKKGGEIAVLDPQTVSFNLNWTYEIAPAGGINSSAKDMAKWLILQANEGSFKGDRIISKENLGMTHRPFIFVMEKEDISLYYCLGWVYQPYSPYPIVWHTGATLGVDNAAAIMPEEKLGIIVLSNVRDTKLSVALMMQFFDYYFGKNGTDWSRKLFDDLQDQEKKQVNLKPEHPLPAMPLDNYAGTYHNPIFGDALIENKPEGLQLTVGKDRRALQLKHWSHDIFTLLWNEVDPDTKVIFSSDGKNPSAVMDVQLFSSEGSGVFERVKEK